MNSFEANTPFLYLLKTREKQEFSDFFSEYIDEEFNNKIILYKVISV